MILGKHTLADTQALVKRVDYYFKVVEDNYNSTPNKPQDITEDWIKLKSKSQVERESVCRDLLARNLSTPLLSSKYLPTEDLYQRILKFSLETGDWEKGSLKDIRSRFEKFIGGPLDFPQEPGCQASDVDIDIYKKLKSTTDATDAAAEAA